MSETDYLLVLSFPVERVDLEELVEGLLYLSASTGTAIQDAGEKRAVVAYFDEPGQRASVAAQLRATADLEITERDVPRQDWLELYQQSLTAMEVGERFIIAPDRSLFPEDSVRIPIIVPQERAFGTGSHETTSLCLRMLENLDPSGKRCVDIGTGSAILAIAMVKLGAKRVVAFDNDLEAAEAIEMNLQRNGITAGTIIPFIGGPDALRGGEFELATMNIIPEVIVPLLPGVRRLLAPDASTVFSGILLSARNEFLAAAERQGLTLRTEASMGEWWCGVFGS